MNGRLLGIRVMVVLAAVLGINYVAWRWLYSVNWEHWWVAVPLVLAETYSLVATLLFGLGVWRLRERGEPPPAPAGLTVDVFIATYDEPVDLVMRTARAAQRIHYPHRTWILDDGNRPELRTAAEAEGIGWITRSEDWAGMPRHAKAGNLNNALLATEGEFMLILDADQVPFPEILDRTLGLFADPGLALVQTPQVFVNVPEDDPLGSQAPLFYGPIQQSKDGWNAAFFCGSNAVLRREALMRLGVSRYVGEVEVGVHRALRTARRVVGQARRKLGPGDPDLRRLLDDVGAELDEARRQLALGAPLFDVTYEFQRRIGELQRARVRADLSAVQADLAEIGALDDGGRLVEVDPAALDRLAEREWSPLAAVETVQALVAAIDVDRADQAQPIMPLATISVTEDMATSMRLHALGWRSAYVDEQLAEGLAPEDLGSMLTQRLRWAQGTMQVMFRENPLTQRGLTWPQRLMYFATMWSYLSGFAALAFLAAPVLYLVFGVLPVQAFSTEFFVRLVPFLVVNQLLFLLVARGRPVWRGQQYTLALFPTWIRSVTSALGNVYLGRELGFAVTPKTRREAPRSPWRLVAPQLVAIAVLALSLVVGAARVVTGDAQLAGSVFNAVWVGLDLLILWVVVEAARYRGFDPDGGPVPDPVHARPAAH